MQRRDFIRVAGGMAILGVSAFPLKVSAQQAAQREDIETFSRDPSKVAALRLAFDKLQARKPNEKIGWFNYAAIHGVRGDDPVAVTLPVPLRTYWNQCHRDRRLFFIWHRAYLAAFERNLQELSGVADLHLPYWDWYSQPALPTIFRSQFLDAAQTMKNPLFHPRRKGLEIGARVWNPASSGAIDETGYADFQRLFEENEHGDIHVFVGGDMGAVPTAARDPIFWLHHCNVDRLLAAWVSRTGNKVSDQGAAFDAGAYKFPVEKAQDYAPRGETLDMSSTAPFGVSYQSLSAPFKMPAPQSAVALPTATQRIASGTRTLNKGLLALNASTSVSVPNGGVNIVFALPKKNDSQLKGVFSSASLGEASSVVVHLDGVVLNRLPEGVSGFDVFVNLPAVQNDAPASNKVGTVSLFELTMTHDHEGMSMFMPMNFAFPATRQFKSAGAGRADLVVSLVPRIAPDTVIDAAQPLLSIRDARIEASSNPVI